MTFYNFLKHPNSGSNYCYSMIVAILGANSHIGKTLIFNFSHYTEDKLFLFTRKQKHVLKFIQDNNIKCKYSILDYTNFNDYNFDLIVNCIGSGQPSAIKLRKESLFLLNENFDNLVINYLIHNPNTYYFYLSSGAVYGTDFSFPAEEDSVISINTNNLTSQQDYSLIKIYTEKKHRDFVSYNIIDLRIFNFFSRFIDLNSRFLITDIINCIKSKSIFSTNSNNIIRDYLHPLDLYNIVVYLFKNKVKNSAFDLYSKQFIYKFELLKFLEKKFSLKHTIRDEINFLSPTGEKVNYYSNFHSLEKFGFFPAYTSQQCLEDEIEYLL